MIYYEATNEYPEFSLIPPWYWEVQGYHYNPDTGQTMIDLAIGYNGSPQDDYHLTSQIVANAEDAANAVMSEVSVYADSAGPIHGGGFPKK